MEGKKFKVGDRVKVKEHRYSNCPVDSIGLVTLTDRNDYDVDVFLPVRLHYQNNDYWFKDNDLELVESVDVDETETEVDILDRRYEEGMKTFWECMQHFWYMDLDDVQTLFHEGNEDYTSENIIDKIGIQEFVDRIHRHMKESEKFKVGDIVEHCEKGDVRIIVTAIYDNGDISGFNETGVFSNRDANSWKKTGEHVDLSNAFEVLKGGK